MKCFTRGFSLWWELVGTFSTIEQSFLKQRNSTSGKWSFYWERTLFDAMFNSSLNRFLFFISWMYFLACPGEREKEGLITPWITASLGSVISDVEQDLDVISHILARCPKQRDGAKGIHLLWGERAGFEPGWEWAPSTAAPLLSWSLLLSFSMWNLAPFPKAEQGNDLRPLKVL